MWMDFQGKKATHDFLSLYNKESSFQQQDSRLPSQGVFLETHDFLKPLEKTVGEVGPTPQVVEPAAHVLRGGIGTYSISHVEGGCSVKPEAVTCSPNGPHLAGRKPEPDRGGGGYGSFAFTLWESKENGNRGGGQWPSAFAARTATNFASLSSSRNQPAHDKKQLMESGSRSSRGFNEDDDEDDGFSRRETHKGEMTVKVDGKGGNDQRATTPRSKHSATEQRRRSKINDRFQILRDLIPHSDQKRDKASFLLEVIEYIRFLQEKVHKHESSYPGCSEENAKLMPWSSSQVPGGNVTDPSQIMKNGASEFIYSGKFDDNNIPVAPAMLSSPHNPVESELSAGVSYRAMENSTGFTSNTAATPSPLQPCPYASVERGTSVAPPQPGLISDIDNLASQSQSQWLRPSCPADCSVSNDLLNGPEELTIDEGTINVSAAYSQNLLSSLNQALESYGIDLSQANVSVQINLGKRATSRGPPATTTMCSAKDLDNPSSLNQGVIVHSRVGSSGEESERGTKRRKPDS